ncbi:S9 family peptidase [Ornithinibacillus halophilus]|uniref:Acyl-peptide hydrolase n=1 Tax=Ornithinibacillus halophilus TaxID=930117 RepID=A0A1M5LKE6_9BACI|nr:alpha/beta fold hydrolase [Ornithinibacillus halophilus]SHG65485.1 Dipeptidyl aminopeptidase/acylaminoacyl peptidase [Ornithinibacillus halophilus]
MTEANKQATRKKYTIEQFMNTESITGVSFSHDGSSILYSSDKTGVYNAYSMDKSGHNINQLTNSTTDYIVPVSYFPEDHRFLYESDQGGNEITHLFVQDDNGQSKELTTGAEEKAYFQGWSKDKKSFFYESNKRDSRYMDLYEMDIATFSTKLLFKNEEGYEISTISPDKSMIALHKPITANNSDMYLYSKDGSIEHLSSHEGDVQYIPVEFDATNTYLYYLTDEDNEFLLLNRVNLNTREVELVAKEEWDIRMVKFSPNYQYLLYALNNDGKIEIKLMDTNTDQFVDIVGLPDGQISGVTFSQNEESLAFLLNSSNSPTNLYVYDFTSKQLDCLTDTLNPEIDQADLVEAKVVHYSSFDGLEIPAIYYEPHLETGQKAPALVWVHGGPGGQSMVNYNPVFQYLVNHGYAVIAVNNRGSSGYGKSFFKAADLKHGEVDLEDCVQAKKFLTSTGKIDEDRIGIIGGSYGGYMVLAALAFQPDAFKVGVDIFGVSNWERTLKNIPAWWETMRDALYKKLGNPFTDTEYVRSISPLFHAENINKPLIVLQGANDPRVLKVESDEIVESVRKNNIPVEYVVFDDEGHGFTKRENRIKGYQAIKEFLDTYL